MLSMGVRHEEEMPWVPVDPEETRRRQQVQDERGPTSSRVSKVEERRLRHLPPSLIPVPDSVFETTPPVEWG